MTEHKPVVLVVDDERDHADGIVEALERLPVKALAVYTGEDAIEMVRRRRVDVVVTDLKLEGQADGLDVLREARQHSDSTQVILITAYATIENCKEAIKQGAFDYLVKPLDIDQLRTLVEQASRKAASAYAARAETEPNQEGFLFEGIKGNSPAMQKIFEVVRRVAPTNISVLIEGPSGTGKELLARAIHDNSLRRNKPFRPVNCAGLTETLLESELFGHVKGAFTGANTDRKGLFEIAHEGTLFLDEIGDMPLTMQAKLLRVLEDGLVVPVGSSKAISVDVRVISATNHSLNKLIEQNRFREDLYFRIKGVNVSLPALRERPEDIPLLVEHFLAEAAEEIGSNVRGVSDAAMQILVGHDWPGNIRQLKNAVRTMVVMCDRDRLDVQDIPPEISRRRQLTGASVPSPNLAGVSLNDIEKKAIVDTLAKTEGNREKAARILGIGERTLYRKIKEYNL
ncbi:MAG TPA: sigma-54 dependent transcriptional regulator [Sedimentisphaerales bacterium]|nr:sigma-54 dependent transcriptional regulator [Sedimentisphaerales bacterium]HRS12040.1 sigma-54 dependent transcriptional regulator [Sedimentisphaerales bacterium]HRV48527.1 sigma-54 dependent transcriptional regulator [Sedimentisphaerales bacterium]